MPNSIVHFQRLPDLGRPSLFVETSYIQPTVFAIKVLDRSQSLSGLIKLTDPHILNLAWAYGYEIEALKMALEHLEETRSTKK